ncbi:MAG: DNA gyrase subunit A [Chrysiogenetes bacterium]|nr:DNA gyrase subunit A [Chrysiogenetes bacterium]
MAEQGPGQPPLHISIEDEMRQSYMSYAMSVIVGRALPDVRDGLKPVHRRILYAMLREGLRSNTKYSKCAGVVGEVLKKYHPHGDSAVYDALVRMAQHWNLRYPLIDGQGNFGSVDGDPPAAYRYTECRLTALAEELMADIDKETIDFSENFDGSTAEPVVLPSRVPNLLINGSGGIAVGMATNIPPHNLREVSDACKYLIDNPTATVEQLMKFVPGPDLPTGGIITGRDGIHSAYKTGRGGLQIRGRAEIETYGKDDRERIAITEIPYQVNKTRLIEKIAELVRDKRIEGISDLRDESDRTGMRVVVELKRDAVANVVLNQLYKHTPLQTGFGIIMLALVHGQPVVLNLKEMLVNFVDHRREVITRRTAFELREAKAREHILMGFKIALDNLDAVIELIRNSKDPAIAKAGLIENFGLSELQATEILQMRLQRLTGLERDKILQELEEIKGIIARLEEILADEKKVLAIIKADLDEMSEKYGNERRTEITGAVADINAEDLIAEEDMVVSVSHQGYIKRSPTTTYRAQRRGGRGVMGTAKREEDFVTEIFVASTHSYLLIFTNMGRLYWLKVYNIPAAGRTAKGKAIVNLLQLKKEEKVQSILPVREFEEGRFVVMATRKGYIKKTSMMEFSRPRNSGLIALNIEEDDELAGVRVTDGSMQIMLATRAGMACRFDEENLRPMGRTARGVRGIRLGKDDEVVDLVTLKGDESLLTVMGKGYGKRTPVEEYRLISRGGKGVINAKVTDRTGEVVACRPVAEGDQLMLITDGGKMIRMDVDEISEIGRATQGVRLITVGSDEAVTGVAQVAREDGADEEGDEGDDPGEAGSDEDAGGEGDEA